MSMRSSSGVELMSAIRCWNSELKNVGWLSLWKPLLECLGSVVSLLSVNCGSVWYSG